MAEPFEFTEIQAEHILDMQLAPAHPAGPHRARERARASCARRSPSSRRSSPTTAMLRTVIKDELAEVTRRSSPTPRTSQITFDAGDMRHRGPHRRRGARRHDDRGGYVKTVAGRRVPHPGPRRPRRARRQAARTRTTSPHHLHHRARLPAVLLEPRPGLPAEGARDPDEGAHGAGHCRSSTCCRCSRTRRSRRSSTPATTRRAASCSSPPSKGR